MGIMNVKERLRTVTDSRLKVLMDQAKEFTMAGNVSLNHPLKDMIDSVSLSDGGAERVVKEVYNEAANRYYDFISKKKDQLKCYDPNDKGMITAIRIYNEGTEVCADLAFAYGGSTTIVWTDYEEREKYSFGINGYTVIYDERALGNMFKATFEKFTL